MPDSSSPPQDWKTLFGYWWLLLLVVFVLVRVPESAWNSLWNSIFDPDRSSHDELTSVNSDDWSIGEYKECSSPNLKADDLYLECTSVASGTARAKTFKVRFHGRTFVEGQTSQTVLDWNCRKNGTDDPTITCERRPEEKKAEVSPGNSEEAPSTTHALSENAKKSLYEDSCVYRFRERGISSVDGKPVETACKENPEREPAR